MVEFLKLTQQTSVSKQDFLKYYGATFNTSDKSDSIFKFLDKDNDGKLSYNELQECSGKDKDVNTLTTEDMYDACAGYIELKYKEDKNIKIGDYMPDAVRYEGAGSIIADFFGDRIYNKVSNQPEPPITDLIKLDANNLDPAFLKKIGIDQTELDAVNEIKSKLPDSVIYAAKVDGKYHLYTKFKGSTSAGGENAKYGKYTDYVSIVSLKRGDNNLYLEGGDKFHTASPLIIDMDGDGIEAQQGVGINIDGKGGADGAAVGDDRMLGFDRNGDGVISGDETFGNFTVDPYTGKSLEAANGFEALKKFAESVQAKYNAGKDTADMVDLIDVNGNVDMIKLNQALEATGKSKIGFTHYDGTKNVFEDLSKVTKINVSKYTDHTEENKNKIVQENQVGSGVDENGNELNVTDVWFKVG